MIIVKYIEMNNPLVTVLLPVYNRESVNKCIESVLSQSFTNFELLIIDNASTDNTINVINSFDDERIRLIINEKNIGQTGSLNKGLDLARGKYIARIDSDDLMLKQRLEKQVEFMENNPEYGLCGSLVKTYNDNDNKTYQMSLCVSDDGIRAFQGINSALFHPAVMYRTSVLRENNIYYDKNYKIAEDYDLWDRLLSITKAYNIPEILTLYKVDENSDSFKYSAIKMEEYYGIRKRICEIDRNKNDSINSIKYEKKERKNIFDCLKIYKYLTYYLSKHNNLNEYDYNALKSCVNSRIYNSCVNENNAFYVGALKTLFTIYSKMKKELII